MSAVPAALAAPQNLLSNSLHSSTTRSDAQVDGFFNFKLVSFKAENTIFRVLTHGLNNPGTIFEAMFSLPAAEDGEGSSNENPIVLEEVLAGHFRAFLCVLYSDFGNQTASVVEFDDWVGVLALSTIWECRKVRTEAIASVSRLLPSRDVLEMLHLGRKYRVAGWILDSLLALATKSSFKMEELTESSFGLEWETIAHIFYIQELRMKKPSYYCGGCSKRHVGGECPFGYYSSHSPVDVDKVVRDLIEDVFKDELRTARETGL